MANCTSYAAYTLNLYGVYFDNKYLQGSGEKWGNAGHWNDAAERAGISVDDHPIPGDVAHWNTLGGTGHVAWVEKVYFDKAGNVTSIDVSEYNYIKCDWGYRNLAHGSSDYPDGFIHILAYNEGVTGLFYLDCYEMNCPGQTKAEWKSILDRVWGDYRCENNCNSNYPKGYISSLANNIGGMGGGGVIPAFKNSNVKIKSVKLSDSDDKAIDHTLGREPGSRYNIHIALENKGNKKAEDVEIRYYTSNDKNFGDGDDKFLASDWINSITSGEIVFDRKTKDKDDNSLKAPKNLGEYYLYVVVIVHGDSTSNISSDNDKDEYAKLEVEEYVPPPPPKTIKISSPNGDKWRTDKEYSIKWNSENLSKSSHVKIELSLNDGSSWTVIDSYAVNDGSKKIKLKNFGVKKDTDKARIRVTSVEYPKVSDTSKFKIDYKK